MISSPASSLSFSTLRLQVVFGLPLLLFPSSAQVYIAMLQSLFWSCLSICPIIFHLRHFNSSLSGFMSALSNNSSVLTWSCQWIRRILRRHLLSETHQLLCSLLVHFPCFQLSVSNSNVTCALNVTVWISASFEQIHFFVFDCGLYPEKKIPDSLLSTNYFPLFILTACVRETGHETE